jgi:fluoride exporter
MAKAILLVFLGGGAGSVARYLIGRWATSFGNFNFPIGTFVSNLLSCLILGIIVYAFSRTSEMPNTGKLLLITGFCGGFSTFSTFSYETLELIKGGHLMIALINILISVTVCILILWVLSSIKN